MQNFEEILKRKLKMQKLVNPLDYSMNPLELFRQQDISLTALDLEISTLKELKPRQAGYRPTFNVFTGKPGSVGTSLIEPSKLIQFAAQRRMPSGATQSLGNIIIPGSEYGLTRGAMWEGHFQTGIGQMVLGQAPLAPGMQAKTIPQARSFIQQAISSRSPDILLGHNIAQADINWLKQFGVNTGRTNVIDLLDIARVAHGRGGYQGGQTLESLVESVLGVKMAGHHRAEVDVEYTQKVFEALVGPDAWQGYTMSQRRRIMEIISGPAIGAQMGIGMMSNTASLTGSMLFDPRDIYRLRTLSKVAKKPLFRLQDGTQVLREVSLDRGHILAKARAISEGTEAQLAMLMKRVDRFSRGRMQFMLERSSTGVEHLFLGAYDPKAGRILGDAVPIPWHQPGMPGLITRNQKLAATTQFYDVVGKGIKTRTFGELAYREMRTSLREQVRGGIKIGPHISNVGMPLLRAIGNAAMRGKVLGTSGAADVIERGGRMIPASALGTALVPMNLLGRQRELLPHILGGRVRPTAEAMGQIPGLLDVQAIYHYINTVRVGAMRKGEMPIGTDLAAAIEGSFGKVVPGFTLRDRVKASIVESSNARAGLKPAQQMFLDWGRSVGLSELGVKPEQLMRGVLAMQGMQYGLTNKGLTKGYHQMADIMPMAARGTMPRVLPSGMSAMAGSLSAGRQMGFGATVAVANMDRLKAYSLFGDPGMFYTRRALPYMMQEGPPVVRHLRDLSDDILTSLTPAQRAEITAGRTITASIPDRGVIGTRLTSKGNIRNVYAPSGFTRAVIEPGPHFQKVTLRRGGPELFRTHASMLWGSQRTTAHAMLPESARGLHKAAHFVTHQEWLPKGQAEFFHYAGEAFRTGRGEEFYRAMQRIAGGQLGALRAGGQLQAFDMPEVDVDRLAKSAAQFMGPEFAPQVSGKYTFYRNQPIFHRTSADLDLGTQMGGALRMRLKSIEERAMLERELGMKGAPLSTMLRSAMTQTRYGAKSQLDFHLNILAGMSESDVIRRAKELKLNIYTPQQLSGVIRHVDPNAILTRADVGGTYYDVFRNRGFILDLGKSGATHLPMGYHGETAMVTSGARRFAYIPAARIAQFGMGQQGVIKPSSLPAARFAEVLNVALRGGSEAAVGSKLIQAYLPFQKRLLGKDGIYDAIAMRTPRLTPSARLRAVTKLGTYGSAAEDVFTVQVHLPTMRKYRRQLGISKEFIQQINSGEAFAFLGRDPHQRLEHESLVRLVPSRGRQTYLNKLKRGRDKLTRKGKMVLEGLFAGIHPSLLGIKEGDVDMDTVYTLFLDTKHKLFRGSNVSNAELADLWRRQSAALGPQFEQEFMSMVNFRKSSVGQGLIDRAEASLANISMKAEAPMPWVYTRNEAFLMRQMHDIGRMHRQDTKLMVQTMGRMMRSQFGLLVGEDNTLAIDALQKVAKRMPSARDVRATEGIIQRLMQYSLEKGGKTTGGLKDITEQALIDLSGIRAKVYGMLEAHGPAALDQSLEMAQQESKRIISGLLESAQAQKGALKLSIPKAASVETFSRMFGQQEFLRGSMAFAHGSKSALASSALGSKIFTQKYGNAYQDLIEGKKTPVQAMMGILGMTPEEMDQVMRPMAEIDPGADVALRYAMEKEVNLGGVKADVASSNVTAATKGSAVGDGMKRMGGMFDEFLTNIGEHWKNPYVRLGAYGLGGLAALGIARNTFVGDDGPYMAAPNISSAYPMQAGTPLPPSPRVDFPDEQYPASHLATPVRNPVEFQQRTRLGRNEPAIHLRGSLRPGTPYDNIENIADHVSAFGINNATINITDSRRRSDISAPYAARDMLNSDL